MFKAFHQSGWSKVTIGTILYRFAWSLMKEKVEYIQVMFPGLRSIIGKNMTDAVPGWGPSYTACIIPDQNGRGVWRWRDKFHNASKLWTTGSWWVGIHSFSLTSEWRPVHVDERCLIFILPTAKRSSDVTDIRGMGLSFFGWDDCANDTHAMKCVKSIQSSRVMINVISHVLNVISGREVWDIIGLGSSTTSFLSLDFMVWAAETMLTEWVDKKSRNRMMIDLHWLS